MDIFETFRAAANIEQAAKMSAYMRGNFTFLGIPTPQRKKLSAEFIKSQKTIDWELIFKLWDEPEREFQYLAVEILSRRKIQLSPADITSLKRLITTKSWWDTSDILDVIVGDIALRYPALNRIMLKWSKDKNIWLRRVAIDHQLTRKERTDKELLRQIITNNLGESEFFINKAIGWSLRAYSKENPEWVRKFLEENRSQMATLSVKEAEKYL